jgi:quercetin dioxygenase-like cupin family protein
MTDDHTDAHLPDAEPTGQVRPVDLRDYADFSQDEARRVRVFATAHLALDLWCIEPQQATSVLRYADSDVTYTVLGGRSWFVTEQGEIGLDPLAAMLVPAGVTHGIDNRGSDPLIVLASSAPPDAAAEDPPVSTEAAAIRPEEGPSVAQRVRAFLAGRR